MRNKSRIVSLALVLAFAFGVSPVFAQNRPATGSDRTKASEAVRTQQSERAKEARKKTVKRLMTSQVERSQRAIDKLSAILVKIQARRDKMATDGANVTAIDKLIADSKTKKTQAETILAKARVQYNSLDTASDPKAEAEEFIKTMKDLRVKLLELHKTLKETVKVLRSTEKSLNNTRTNSSNRGTGENN